MHARLNQNDVANLINVEDADQVRDAVIALFAARYPGAYRARRSCMQQLVTARSAALS